MLNFNLSQKTGGVRHGFGIMLYCFLSQETLLHIVSLDPRVCSNQSLKSPDKILGGGVASCPGESNNAHSHFIRKSRKRFGPKKPFAKI